MESDRAYVTMHRLREEGWRETGRCPRARENHFELHSGEAIPPPTAWKIVVSSYYTRTTRAKGLLEGASWRRLTAISRSRISRGDREIGIGVMKLRLLLEITPTWMQSSSRCCLRFLLFLTLFFP